MIRRPLAIAFIGLIVPLMSASAVRAAEIRVIASNGVKAALEELAPAFERQTGHKITVKWGLAGVLKRDIESGEAFDLAILTSAGIDDLAKQGKVDGGTRASIARSGVGIGVKQGAPRPDISTPEALKKTLLAAKSVAWPKEGQSGIYFAGLLDRMGIGEPVKAKATLVKVGADVGKALVSGQADLGVVLVNELMAQPGVEVLGPLPPELQSYTVFHAGVGADSKNADAAKALIQFLVSPSSAAVFKAKGQEPG
jgi:molybdate transport system substrate-binding protein